MNTILKLIIIVALNILSSAATSAQAPNILLIIADDLGVDALNGYNVGNFDPNTPHLDSIRNSGVNFVNAWSSAVCSPTRAGMLTGMYGSLNGVRTVPSNLDTSHISLFDALKDSAPSYSAAVSGKWHMSHPVNILHPIMHGADHYMGVLEGAVAAYDNWDKTENNVTAKSTEYATSCFTDDAINWISRQDNPWFLWLSHVAPHTPLHVPPAHMYTQPSTNAPLKKYMAMIESLDYEVGRLLDALTPAEKANTTIIFIGDNGTPNSLLQEYPADHGKSTLYQGGIHVPMFVSGYGVSRIGEKESALVNVIDIYATVLEMTGSDLPGGINNSLSFKHLLTSSSLPKRQFNFSELDSNLSLVKVQGYAIRDSIYKLIEYHDGHQEMFNLIDDPLETDDLLLGTLTPQQTKLKLTLENEANQRRTAWSCNDGIQNGDEEGIDCGGTYCSPCTSSADDQADISSNISVFPNPAESSITIASPGQLIQNIKLFNILGELVLSKQITNYTSTTIDISHLATGIYYLQINFSSHTNVRKLIVK